MYYREIKLRSNELDSALTEITYELAAARVDSVELVRINLTCDEIKATQKLFDGIIRHLKGIKRSGKIQFFATEQSFADGSTEAVFLANKYPELLTSSPSLSNDIKFIYIKI